jgi:hypothetical protein
VGRGVRPLLLATCVGGAFFHSAAAQTTILDRLKNLDKLQIASLGGFVGRILPSQLEPANLVALQADYGEVAPSWHAVFGVSYWESRFRDAVIQTFVDSLQKSLTDSSAHVVPSRVSLYDVAFGVDLRYTPTYPGALKPFVGLGVAAHVINAEGKLIRGTFVERSLDNIAAGFYLTTGVALQILHHFGVEANARGDLLSGFRSVQARAGAAYYFGHIRGGGGQGSGSWGSGENGDTHE